MIALSVLIKCKVACQLKNSVLEPTWKSSVGKEEPVTLPEVPELAPNEAVKGGTNKAIINWILSKSSSEKVNIT